MSKGFVLLGDETTHGGKVISTSSTMIVNGKNVALIGDMVSCPIPFHGPNPIVEGSLEWSSDGKAIVVERMQMPVRVSDYLKRTGLRNRIIHGLEQSKIINNGDTYKTVLNVVVSGRRADTNHRDCIIYDPRLRYDECDFRDQYLAGFPRTVR